MIEIKIRLRETGQVVTEREFRAMPHDGRERIFPAVLDAATLDAVGADAVLESPAPVITEYQTSRREGAVRDALGNWVHAWEVRDWTQDEIAAHNAAKTAAMKKALSDVVQSHLDVTAQARGYDNIVSACSYAGAANPFQGEGIAYTAWRGDAWAACYAVMADVQSGARSAPTAAELISELPALILP